MTQYTTSTTLNTETPILTNQSTLHLIGLVLTVVHSVTLVALINTHTIADTSELGDVTSDE